MKYLQILNAVVAAVGASFTVVLGVVCLIYAVYLGEVPRLARELPMLLAMTAGFAALGAFGWLAFQGQRRGRPWAWAMEGAVLLDVAGLAALVMQLRV
ncbi:MAG: hypothetical protein HYV18_05320 [Gammaproteobacteria bacterium]|nr:hypothetical protein [Gammaproteobacteria bacterium]